MMLTFQRTIKQRLGHLNGFIMLLGRGIFSKNVSGLTAGVLKRTSAAVAVNVQRAVVAQPPGVRRTAFLFSGLVIPVVTAWSPWSKKDEDAAANNPLSLSGPQKRQLRLVNSKNLALRDDLRKADDLYDSGGASNCEEAIKTLEMHHDKGEPEVLWRLGRLHYEKSKTAKSGEEKRRLIEEAYELVLKSLEIDEKNFAIHKWMAILLNEMSQYQGIKTQILESVNVKKHMLRAAELNPDDPTAIHLLGQWCFSVADIPWYQRKVAATLFAEPPQCTFQEAYNQFLRAEMIEPGFYSMNLLMLAKSAIKVGEMAVAEKYLLQLKNVKVKTEDDFVAKTEGKKLREGYFKS